MTSKTTPVRVQAVEREQQAVALRLGGATFRQIGDKLGVTEASAWKMVKRVMDRTVAEANEQAEELRQLEAERLDAMMLALWPQASRGSLGAVDRVLRIMQRRAQLLGLDLPARAPVDGDGEAVLPIINVRIEMGDDGRT